MTAPNATSTDDQTNLPLFKATLIAQAAAGLVFGLAPLLVQAGYVRHGRLIWMDRQLSSWGWQHARTGARAGTTFYRRDPVRISRRASG